MNSMYGHLVYTRCSNPLDLSGQPKSGSGYGVFSLSKRVLTSPRDAGLQQKIVSVENESDQVQGYLVDSYTYVVPPIGEPIMVKTHARTQEEIEAARREKNDGASAANIDLRYSHVNEALVGQPHVYPWELFDSDVWRAGSRPIRDYYQGLSCTDSDIPVTSVRNGPITRAMAVAFAQDGRLSAIRSALCMLLAQFDLPVSERKYLLIRDTEPNIRLWIAAIGYALPRQLARKIGFSTSFKEAAGENAFISIQKGNGQFLRVSNLQDPNQERVPLVMIAGISPTSMSDAVRKTSVTRPVDKYLIVDGKTKTALFEAPSSVSRDYYRDLIQNDASICDFTEYLDELQSLPLGSVLADLYDAQQVLVGDASWEYSRVLQALQLLEPHITSSSCLIRLVMDKMCNRAYYSDRFSTTDEQNNLTLLRMLFRFSSTLQLTSPSGQTYGNVLMDLATLRFIKLLKELRNATDLERYASLLKQHQSDLYKKILKVVFESEHLSFITEAAIRSATDDTVNVLLSVISDYCSIFGYSWNTFLKNEVSHGTVALIFARCMKSDTLVSKILKYMQGDTAAIQNFVGISITVGKPNEQERHRFWRVFLQNHISLTDLCAWIHQKNIGYQDIEWLLCQTISERGSSDEIRDLFRRYLASVPNAGASYYAAWLSDILSKPGHLHEAELILKELESKGADRDRYRSVLESLDRSVRLDQSKETEYLVHLISKKTEASDAALPNTSLWLFLDGISGKRMRGMKKSNLADLYLSLNRNAQMFPVKQTFFTTDMCESFMGQMLSSSEDPTAHLISLMAFRFATETDAERYIGSYVAAVCDEAVRKKNNALASFVALCDNRGRVGDATRLIGFFPQDEVSKRFACAMRIMQQVLSGMKLERVSDKFVSDALKTYGASTAEHLQEILEQAKETYQRNHKGLFSGFFQGFGKK